MRTAAQSLYALTTAVVIACLYGPATSVADTVPAQAVDTPATQGTLWRFQGTGATYGSEAAACSGPEAATYRTTAGNCWSSAGASTAIPASPPNIGAQCRSANSNPSFTSVLACGSAQQAGTGYSCSSGSLVGNICRTYVCPEGYAGPDANNMCNNGCTAGDTLTRNRTVCYTRSNSPGVSLQECATPLVNNSLPGCFNSCKFNVTGLDKCWGGTQASAQGLYRISCDYLFTATGQACNPAQDTPPSDNPADPQPSCPGTLGNVNGKPVCLDPVPPAGQAEFRPGQPYPGNPRAGTGPAQPSGEREPETAGGGNPGAGGGPGITDPARGGTGQGGTSGTGTGSPTGGGEPTKIEVEVETCGLPGKPPCKLDETGTPNGNGSFTGASDALKAVDDAEKAGIDSAITSSGRDTSWGLSFPTPTNCQPYQIWGGRSVDLCAYAPQLHVLASMIWVGCTLFACLGMVRSAITGGA